MTNFYLGFAAFPGIGPAKFQLLLQTFTTVENAWKASLSSLKEVLGEKLAGELVAFRETFSVDRYASALEKKKIGFVTLEDQHYSPLLRDIKQPPFIVFYKGNSDLFREQRTIAVVGTRTISQYGREVTQMLTSQLVDEHFVIVSGLALGVDGVAHETTLEKKGKTIAVLGSGVDMCTPREHQKLYDKIIAEGGLVASTRCPGEQPTVGSFPARNKVIAGLSLGTVVTEGAAGSGALYTADFARNMGRPVFSVPGPITSKLSGATTKLLKEGATAITGGQDIVDSLGIITNVKTQKTKGKNLEGDTPEEQEILDLLQIEPLHFNEIARKIGKDSKALGSLLSLMELKGMVQSLGNGQYSL